MTSDGERERLLRIARDAMTAHVTGKVVGEVEPGESDSRLGAAFVTITKRGVLRGCIGHLEANQSLTRVVAQCAVAACSADPRFPAVAPGELGAIEIELSLLGPLERASGLADIEVGRHGLVVELSRRRGLLLPQVATERGWDAATFLSQTCRKAGLPADSWQHGASLWRFEAEVFCEAAKPTDRDVPRALDRPDRDEPLR